MTDNLRALMARLRGLLGIRKAELEFGDEIQAHLNLLTERYIRQGLTRDEAAAAARRQFGNVTLLKEVNREMRGLRLIDTFFQDLRYGLTILKRNPGFSFVVTLTLALGIGANTAIFSVVNAVLLRSLPYRDPDKLMLLSYYRGPVIGDYTQAPEYLEWRDQAKAFEQIAAQRFGVIDLTGSGEPERLSVGFVSANLFATLGAAPALGRDFTPAEDANGGPPVVILSDSLWRRRFGGDPQMVGQAITLGGQSRTVVGIMPPGFQFFGEVDLWAPLALNVSQQLSRQGSIIRVTAIARLKPSVTPEAARADMSVILERQRQSFPQVYSHSTDLQVRVTRLSESLVGNVRSALLILFGAVAFVLLIACANVANLLLARSAARQKEMAIRAAVGAGRLRLVRQLLTESLLLSLAGGAVGLLASKWGIELLVAMRPDGIARLDESSIDGRVAGFTFVVAVLTGLLAGIFPALQASKTDINETLKGQSTAGGVRMARGGGQHTLPALMIAEIAFTLILLVGAGLMIRSFLTLLAVPKGFNPNGVLTLTLMPGLASYPLDSPQRRAYFQKSLARIQSLPGIQSAGLTSFLPLTAPTLRLGIDIEGRPPFEPGKQPIVDLNFTSPEYFKTVGIELRAGRSFNSQDGPAAAKVVIVNETLARRLFPDDNPIGHSLLMWMTPRIIVGVAGDTRHLGLDQEVRPEVYIPYLQGPSNFLTLVVQAASGQKDPSKLSTLASVIRGQVSAIEPNEPVNPVVTLDQYLSNSLAWRRFQMLLLSIFAAVAFVVATIGIYGVISYAVSQRTHEIGIRMALGAKAGDVLRMVVWRGMRLALIGVVLGAAAALALTRVLKNQLFEVSATDPATFALIALLLIGVALIASYIPARRATKVDPLQALRHQ